MKKYFVEIVVGIVMVLIFLAVSAWQSSETLTKAEVDRYIDIMEKNLPVEIEERDEFIARMRDWGERDDGKPVYMLNLMRFYDEIKPIPGVPETFTPMEANEHYEDVMGPKLVKSGSYPYFGGDTSGISEGQEKSNLLVYEPELDAWDRVLIVRYTGRRAFFDLVTDPEYLKVEPYKRASLKVVLVPLSRDLGIPDLRWIAGGIGLTIFLLVGWIRSTRRAMQGEK
jgi:hypothetical protein